MILAATLIAISIASAADVYRCTQNGETTYSMKPCPGGVKLSTDAPPDNSAPAAAKLQADVYASERAARTKRTTTMGEIADDAVKEGKKGARDCARIVDDILRQQVYLGSPYQNTRDSAQAEILIAERKWQAHSCERL